MTCVTPKPSIPIPSNDIEVTNMFDFQKNPRSVGQIASGAATRSAARPHPPGALLRRENKLVS